LFTESVTPFSLYGLPGEDSSFLGLANYLTLWSNEKINVNTASKEMIASLSTKISLDLAGRIVEERQKENAFGKKGFSNEKEFQDCLISQGADANSVFPEIKELIIFHSQYFSIHAIAESGNLVKKMTAIVYRKDKKIYTLFCNWED
jgi:type II secretory pathway component PulK